MPHTPTGYIEPHVQEERETRELQRDYQQIHDPRMYEAPPTERTVITATLNELRAVQEHDGVAGSTRHVIGLCEAWLGEVADE